VGHLLLFPSLHKEKTNSLSPHAHMHDVFQLFVASRRSPHIPLLHCRFAHLVVVLWVHVCAHDRFVGAERQNGLQSPHYREAQVGCVENGGMVTAMPRLGLVLQLWSTDPLLNPESDRKGKGDGWKRFCLLEECYICGSCN
jgi:hypothetical protein